MCGLFCATMTTVAVVKYGFEIKDIKIIWDNKIKYFNILTTGCLVFVFLRKKTYNYTKKNGDMHRLAERSCDYRCKVHKTSVSWALIIQTACSVLNNNSILIFLRLRTHDSHIANCPYLRCKFRNNIINSTWFSSAPIKSGAMHVKTHIHLSAPFVPPR